MTMFEILVVCTGNICRSPMAEGLLKHVLPPNLRDRIAVSSAGTYALHGNQPAPHAVEVMAQWGVDIGGHRARQVSRDMLSRADLTLAMEKSHVQVLRKMLLWKKPPIRLLSEFNPQNSPRDAPDIEDPYGGPLAQYQACLRTLRPCIDGLVDWLTENANLTATDHRDA
jgi:protein-tyrosine phosphatase